MVYEFLPLSEKCAGESFGITNLLGLYYSLDDVANDDPRYGDIEDDILREC